MKIKVQFVLSKGDGEWPDLSSLSEENKNVDYLKSCLEFMPAFDDVESVITNWKLIDAGLDDLTFAEGNLAGYPRPIIEFTLDKEKYDQLFEDKKDFLRGVWESTYQFIIPGINDEDPFYFADFNGYTHIV